MLQLRKSNLIVMDSRWWVRTAEPKSTPDPGALCWGQSMLYSCSQVLGHIYSMARPYPKSL